MGRTAEELGLDSAVVSELGELAFRTGSDPDTATDAVPGEAGHVTSR